MFRYVPRKKRLKGEDEMKRSILTWSAAVLLAATLAGCVVVPAGGYYPGYYYGGYHGRYYYR